MLTINRPEISECITNLSSCDKGLIQQAVMRLFDLAPDEDNKKAIQVAGGIRPLVAVLKNSPGLFDSYAANTLDILASNPDIETEIRQEMIGALRSLLMSFNYRLYFSASGGMDFNTYWITPLVALLGDVDNRIREKSVGIIYRLSFGEDNIAAIVAASGIEPLVALLREASGMSIYCASRVLNAIALNTGNRDAIVAAGGIESLVGLLSNRSEDVKKHAAQALGLLAKSNEDNKNRIREAGGIRSLVDLFLDTDVNVKINAAKALHCLTDRNENNQSAVINANGIWSLVYELKRGENIQLKEDALLVLLDLTRHSVSAKNAIINQGGIPPLAALLSEASSEGKKIAALMLGTLAFNEDSQNAIRKAKGIVPLVPLLSEADLDIKTNGLFALQRLANHNAGNQGAIVVAGGIEPLMRLLTDADVRIKRYAVQTLRFLANSNVDNYSQIINAGGIERLMCLLAVADVSIKKNAALMLGTMAFVQRYRSLLYEAGAVEPLIALLVNDEEVQCYVKDSLVKLSLTMDDQRDSDKAALSFLPVKEAEIDLKPSPVVMAAKEEQVVAVGSVVPSGVSCVGIFAQPTRKEDVCADGYTSRR